ncbi:MAG: hypothetical protein AB7O86_05840 [Porticoccaceae bacterium]
MAIGATLLTSNLDNVDRTSYTTASISPAANSLLLLFTNSSHATLSAPRTVPTSSHGTWVEVAGRHWSSADVRYMGLWILQCGGTPGSGAVTLTENDTGGGTTSTGTGWSIIEVTGHHVGEPIRQVQYPGTASLNTAATSYEVPLLPPHDANSRPFACFAHRVNEAMTHRTNWTELSDNGATSPSMGFHTQWRSDAFETMASSSWATGTGYFGIAVEIAEAGATSIDRATIRSYTETRSEATPVTVTMPPGIVAGDLLVAEVSADVADTVAAGGGEGWTSITDTANGSAVRLKVLAKIAAGGDSLTLTLGGANDTATLVKRITNHGVANVATDITVGTAATGTDANGNPPSATPPANSKWLVIAAAANDDDDNHLSTYYPSGYVPLGQVESTQGTTSTMLQVACDLLTTGSAINPGTFAMVASEEWVAQTILIPPPSSVSPVEVTAQVASLGLIGVAGSPALGAVEVTAQVASLGLTGVGGTHAFGTIDITAQVASLSLAGVAGSPSVGAVAVIAQVASLSLAGVAGMPALGAVDIITQVASLSLAGVAGMPALGAVEITAQVATLSLVAVPGSPEVGAVGATQVVAQVATLLLTAVPGAIALGTASVTSQVAALALTAQPGTPAPGPIAVAGQVGAIQLSAIPGTPSSVLNVQAAVAVLSLVALSGSTALGPVGRTAAVAVLRLQGVPGSPYTYTYGPQVEDGVLHPSADPHLTTSTTASAVGRSSKAKAISHPTRTGSHS